jgi:dihydropteroate synthase
MGIVNVTPDSFSGDGVLSKKRNEKVPGLSHALELIDQGADILDIGGESSRPGARMVTANEELKRVIPLITALAKRVTIPLAVDTYKPVVAERALEAGASIINLIKGTPPQASMLKVVKKYDAGLILMHMRGTPKTMQARTGYKNVVTDVKNELKKALALCTALGIKKTNIVIDPGIGFSKTAEQNLSLLKHLDDFSALKSPVLVGTSRKSFIGKLLGADVKDRLTGTVASTALSAMLGAHIVRVHDVKEMKQAMTITDAILTSV